MPVREWAGDEWQSLSRVQLFVMSWTITHQAPLFMEFSRQEYWSRLSFPSSVPICEVVEIQWEQKFVAHGRQNLFELPATDAHLHRESILHF